MLSRYQLTVLTNYINANRIQLNGVFLVEKKASERAKRFDFVRQQCIKLATKLTQSSLNLPPYPVSKCAPSRVNEGEGANGISWEQFLKAIEIGENPQNSENILAIFYLDTMSNEIDLQRQSIAADVIYAKEISE